MIQVALAADGVRKAFVIADVLWANCAQAHVTRELHQLGDHARVDSKPPRRAGLLLRRNRNIRPLQ